MEIEKIQSTVREIVSDNSGVTLDGVKLESTWEELDMDSLDLVELVMEMEEYFDIIIPDEDAMKFKNLNDIVSFVQTQQ